MSEYLNERTLEVKEFSGDIRNHPDIKRKLREIERYNMSEQDKQKEWNKYIDLAYNRGGINTDEYNRLKKYKVHFNIMR